MIGEGDALSTVSSAGDRTPRDSPLGLWILLAILPGESSACSAATSGKQVGHVEGHQNVDEPLLTISSDLNGFIRIDDEDKSSWHDFMLATLVFQRPAGLALVVQSTPWRRLKLSR